MSSKINELSINAYCMLAAGWRRRKVVLWSILVFTIVGFIVGASMPTTYMTDTSILIQEPALINPFLKDLAISTQLKARIEGLNSLLHSRYILYQVATDMDMFSPGMTAGARGGVLQKLSNGLKMGMVGEDLVQIQYTSDNPENMAETLQRVAVVFIGNVLAPQVSSISNSRTFLQGQLQKRKSDLDQAEQELADYKSQHADELPSRFASHVEHRHKLEMAL